MKNIQKLNSLLLVVLVLISSAVVYKWIKRKGILAEGPSTKKQRQTTQEKSPQALEDNFKQRASSQKVSQKEIDQQYEKVKYDRLIVAMRGHHTRDLERIVAEGLDFNLLPSDAQDKLQQVAQEEDFKSLIAPLFENK